MKCDQKVAEDQGIYSVKPIDLQDESTQVWYKNIKIRSLTAQPLP